TKAAQAIASEIQLEALLAKLIRIAMENAGAERGALILQHEGEPFLYAEGSLEPAEIRLHDALPLEATRNLPISIVNYVRRTSESVVLADASLDDTYGNDPLIVELRPRSILCTPLINQGRLLGVLYLENNMVSGAFTPERIQVMQVLASQTAISLENARLYDEMKQEVARRKAIEERERTLLEINNALMSNLTQDDLFHAIAQALHRVVPFDRSAIFLHDPERDVLKLFMLETKVPSTNFVVGYEMTPNESTSGVAFQNQKAMLRRDLEQERQFPTEDLLFAEGFRALCAVPLVIRSRSIGTLSVTSQTKDLYSEADAEFLQEVAKQVALAVENMKAYSKMQHEVTRRQRAEETLRSITEGTAGVTGSNFFYS
ncbi:MAG: GAF domain-containing protein, partial [Pyrinomonadaceae bacterium]